MRVLYANPERHDYQHATLISGLIQLGQVETSCLNEGNYGLRSDTCLGGDVERALSQLDDFDAVIVGTEGKHSYLPPTWLRLFQARRRSDQRWILVDSGDLGSLPRGVPWDRVDAVVKRELFLPSSDVGTLLSNLFVRRTRHPLENQFRRHSLLAFPNVQVNAIARPTIVSAFQRRQWRLGRAIDVRCEPIGIEERLVQPINHDPTRLVTCTLTPNTVPRRAIIEHLRDQPDVTVSQVSPEPTDDVDLIETGAVSRRRPGDHAHNAAYLRWLHGHRASISFPGAGFDCPRFWEILASGALLISKRVSLDLPVPLIDGRDDVGFDSLVELDEAVRFAVSDSGDVDQIRRQGQHTALAHYSSKALAQRLLR